MVEPEAHNESITAVYICGVDMRIIRAEVDNNVPVAAEQ